jgi:hypothetical protein
MLFVHKSIVTLSYFISQNVHVNVWPISNKNVSKSANFEFEHFVLFSFYGDL